ncbi:MAG TPA: L-threonylcarbamoyladenylate synthase [Candidatus Polarisedimenticolia bacterium]|nr:L-threonylcarbamoyladenylate synthase [Candidatus Polarisedimenticolia bacterium]
MQRIVLTHSESDAPAGIERAAEILHGGGLVIYPTDTLYAIGCDPRSATALERLVDMKRRPATLRLPMVAADRDQVERVARLRTYRERALADRFWPGPLTLVLPRRIEAPLAPWSWGDTLAVRVPGSPPARALARALGSPLPSTSANLSGQAAPCDSAAIASDLLDGVDLLIDAGALAPSPPSSIVQVTEDSWRLLRAGAVSVEELIALLGPPEAVITGRD